MKKLLQEFGILGGGGDATSYDEALRMAAGSGKQVLVDLYVPF